MHAKDTSAEVLKKDERVFFPKGAIAFFASMLVGFGAIWLSMYALLAHRQFHP